ncbi:MAG: hypothetical protein WAO95_10135 [Burkholderiales bacterium]
MSAAPWYRDREARLLIGFRYLPWLAALNLAWEIAHLPLYTLWSEGEPAFIAFAVAHCTLGDVAIGIGALLLALIATGASAPVHWRWGLIASIAASASIAYTAFSEWMNTVVLQSWSYSDLMPTVGIMGIEIGVSPLLQWLVIAPLALRFARAHGRGTQAR